MLDNIKYRNGRQLFVLLAIVLSVLLRYTDSDYPFAIFKLFLECTCIYVYDIQHLVRRSPGDRFTKGRKS